MTMEGESSNQHITQAEKPRFRSLGEIMNVVLASRIGVFRSLWEHEDEEHERLLAMRL